MARSAEHWEAEYRSLVAEQEDIQAAALAVQQLLARALQQLLITCIGRSRQWDEEVDALRTVLQKAVIPADFAALLDRCEALAKGLITDPVADPAATRRLVDGLMALRDETLETMQSYSSLNGLVDPADFMPVDQPDPNRICNDVTRLAQALLTGFQDLSLRHADAERFVDEVRVALAEVAAVVSEDSAHCHEQRDASVTLQDDVDGEVQRLRTTVADSQDLATLRREVRDGFDALSARMAQFRAEEDARLDAALARNQRLRDEVGELREKTDNLKSQLAEQRSLLLLDTLTGVNSRFSYDQRIAEELARCERGEHALTYTIWDIDHFKAVNDQFGHQSGDGVLRSVAQCLVRGTRASDFVARLGGEEFVVLLPDTPADAALQLANQLREAIAATPQHPAGVDRTVTVSAGIAAWQPGDSVASLYERADAALYAAKRHGRNRCMRG
ncbi:MAG: GGDEF domain-containing protein [Pseudomonadota bacterium]